MEALIMRLPYRQQTIALHDIKQCLEPSFQMAGATAGICPFPSPRNGLPEVCSQPMRG